MQITDSEVEYIAELSKLELDDAAKLKMRSELGSIVDYMATLNELDTEDAEPLSHIFDITNVFRKDEVKPSLDRKEILKNAPNGTDESFVVPKTVE